MIATGLLATAVVTLAQLFALSTQTNISSRSTTYASVLAEQKLELIMDKAIRRGTAERQ